VKNEDVKNEQTSQMMLIVTQNTRHICICISYHILSTSLSKPLTTSLLLYHCVKLLLLLRPLSVAYSHIGGAC